MNTTTWHSPGKIWPIGHREVRDLFNSPVQVQEKVDGSFFAFGVYSNADENDALYQEQELKVRSKGAIMYPAAPAPLFKEAVAGVIARQSMLTPEWQYRGETLCRPRHNALSYDRVPKDHVILFDILTGDETYLNYSDLKSEADRLGYEVVPQLFSGKVESAEDFRTFLDQTSILGGQKIEGVVAKPLEPQYDRDGKLLMAKFVGEAFKEVHRENWKFDNPTKADIIDQLQRRYGTTTRWQKAILHLREQGQIDDSPRDIGLLVREIPEDVFSECEDEMKEYLWKWAKPHVRRSLTRGMPEWYKDQLISTQFERDLKDGVSSAII